MYPQKVLQGIPDRKRTVEFSIFDLLIMPQGQAKPVCQLLLGQASFHPCGLQLRAQQPSPPPFNSIHQPEQSAGERTNADQHKPPDHHGRVTPSPEKLGLAIRPECGTIVLQSFSGASP